MRGIDFSSWQSLVATLVGLATVTLIGVGIRLVMMVTIQQRRERMNRQINERLRTLIAAYRTLGGSFTGRLSVDPSHLRELREADPTVTRAERTRRIRDAVEAALSDVILLGTEPQVRLAARAVAELAAGRTVETHELVVSLRDFIREALDLAPIPPDLAIPRQGPTRPAGSGGKSGSDRGGGERGGGDKSGGGGGSGMGAGMGAGMGMGAGLGLGGGHHAADAAEDDDELDHHE